MPLDPIAPAAAETQDILTSGSDPLRNREVVIDALFDDGWRSLDRGLAELEEQLAGGPAVLAMRLRQLAQTLRLSLEARGAGRVVFVQNGVPDEEPMAAPEPKAPQIIDLMDALKASLAKGPR